MPLRAALLLAVSPLAACGESSEVSAPAGPHHLQPEKWTIGPIIRGRNYSPGMPLHPSPNLDGFRIELPHTPDSLHYVTFRHGPLTGKSHIAMRYRFEADPGIRIVPTTDPRLPSVITLYFQRRGDNWSGVRQYETYRWFATFTSHWELKAGEYSMVAPLDADWTAIETSTAATAPAAFREAIANADEVGFVLGGGDGYGHGVHLVGPGRARLIVTDFKIE
jgi:hypothetical protein